MGENPGEARRDPEGCHRRCGGGQGNSGDRASRADIQRDRGLTMSYLSPSVGITTSRSVPVAPTENGGES